LHFEGYSYFILVPDQGVIDNYLSFENHISYVTKTAFFQLRNIARFAKLWNMLSVSDPEKLVHACR